MLNKEERHLRLLREGTLTSEYSGSKADCEGVKKSLKRQQGKKTFRE